MHNDYFGFSFYYCCFCCYYIIIIIIIIHRNMPEGKSVLQVGYQYIV